MIDLVIVIGLIGFAIAAFVRRTDATAGSLLAILLVSILITFNLHGRGLIISAMTYLEAGLAACMAALWLRWFSHRARGVLGLCAVKYYLLVSFRPFAMQDDGWWMLAILVDNALLVVQIAIAGGWGDAVVRWIDRVDPSSARDRDRLSRRVDA